MPGMPRTVFARTFWVLILSGIVTQGALLALLIGVSPGAGPTETVAANLHLYFSYLSRDLARDPDPARARELLRGTRFDVRAEGAVAWDTRKGEPLPNRDVASRAPFDLRNPVWEGSRPAFRYPVNTSEGPVVFTFLAPEGPVIRSPAVLIPVFVAVLAVILAVSFIAIRGILRPIGALSSAFDRMKAGEVNLSLPAFQEDELGRLTRSFNEMAAALHFLMRDRERLFAELSHEFRAPIARINAANALVEDDELRESMERDLRELDALIHAQLTAAKLEAGLKTRLECVDLHHLLEDVRRLFPAALDRIEILVPEPDATVACEADARSLGTLFRNLIENALKYSPAESRVRVRLGTEGERALVSVTDEGMGIPPEDRPFVFEPFFRGDDPRKVKESGFGLGLSLCRRIVHAHGGELGIVSDVERGTTITVLLPVVSARE